MIIYCYFYLPLIKIWKNMHLHDSLFCTISGYYRLIFKKNTCQSEGFSIQLFKMDTKVDVEDEIVIIIILSCINLIWLLHRYMKFYIQCIEWNQTNKCRLFQQILFSNEITKSQDTMTAWAWLHQIQISAWSLSVS